MKYPLNWRHEFVRDLVCFLFGHKWKHAPTRATQYFDMNEEDVPYAYRKSTGNYMWEDISWWKAKCVRCRYKTREQAWNPWFKSLWWGTVAGVRHGKWTLQYLFAGNGVKEFPLWRRVVFVGPLVLATAWVQLLLQFDRLPWAFWTWASEVEYWCHMQIEK